MKLDHDEVVILVITVELRVEFGKEEVVLIWIKKIAQSVFKKTFSDERVIELIVSFSSVAVQGGDFVKRKANQNWM